MYSVWSSVWLSAKQCRTAMNWHTHTHTDRQTYAQADSQGHDTVCHTATQTEHQNRLMSPTKHQSPSYLLLKEALIQAASVLFYRRTSLITVICPKIGTEANLYSASCVIRKRYHCYSTARQPTLNDFITAFKFMPQKHLSYISIAGYPENKVNEQSLSNV